MSNPRFRPMLASQCKAVNELKFPLLATPKIDGIRCITRNRDLFIPSYKDKQVVAVSRSLKEIRNRFIQDHLRDMNLSGFDGELIVGKNFQESTSGIMSEDGEPDFTYMIFDHLNESDPLEPYLDRIKRLIALRDNGIEKAFRVKMLIPHLIENEHDLSVYEESALISGCEGVMLRHPGGPYKFGRATWREHYLIKIKRFSDAEAKVTGLVEKMHNANEAQVNGLGLTERSSHKENKVACGVMGALRVISNDGIEFQIGSGFSEHQRKEIWDNPSHYIGRIARYKYQPHGVKIAPRCPVFIGFRDPDDMDRFSKPIQTELF